MEWGKIKTILIFIFVFVNLFLFVMFFKGEYVDNNLSDELIANTVEILRQNNINVNKELMPKTHDTVRVCTVENKYSAINDMLEDVWKISAQNGTGYFNKETTDIHENYFVCSVDENKDVANITRYVKGEIEKTGLIDNVEYVVEEDEEYIYFYLKFGDKKFYDSYIRVKATEKGISEIYGYNWLEDVVSDGGISQTVSPTEIMIDFALENKFVNPVNVKSIKSGYYTGERGETVRVTASPVWEISVDNGQVFYYDMRNGDLLKYTK